MATLKYRTIELGDEIGILILAASESSLELSTKPLDKKFSDINCPVGYTLLNHNSDIC
jgi:hypothetical protein